MNEKNCPSKKEKRKNWSHVRKFGMHRGSDLIPFKFPTLNLFVITRRQDNMHMYVHICLLLTVWPTIENTFFSHVINSSVVWSLCTPLLANIIWSIIWSIINNSLIGDFCWNPRETQRGNFISMIHYSHMCQLFHAMYTKLFF